MSEELQQDELQTLKARADLLGISYHPSIGVEKLREKLAAAMTEESGTDTQASDAAPAVEEPAQETEGQMRKRLRNEAAKLIRIRLTCMNPAKKDWDGEIITTGNSVVGTFTKYVPFQAEDGWHVPQVILNVLQARECQIFTTVKTRNGVAVRKGKMIREFAIEILPQLTQEELDELARRQAMSHAID